MLLSEASTGRRSDFCATRSFSSVGFVVFGVGSGGGLGFLDIFDRRRLQRRPRRRRRDRIKRTREDPRRTRGPLQRTAEEGRSRGAAACLAALIRRLRPGNADTLSLAGGAVHGTGDGGCRTPSPPLSCNRRKTPCRRSSVAAAWSKNEGSSARTSSSGTCPSCNARLTTSSSSSRTTTVKPRSSVRRSCPGSGGRDPQTEPRAGGAVRRTRRGPSQLTDSSSSCAPDDATVPLISGRSSPSRRPPSRNPPRPIDSAPSARGDHRISASLPNRSGQQTCNRPGEARSTCTRLPS